MGPGTAGTKGPRSHAPQQAGEPNVAPADLPVRLAPLVDLRARALLRNALGDLDGAGDLLERLAKRCRSWNDAAQSGRVVGVTTGAN